MNYTTTYTTNKTSTPDNFITGGRTISLAKSNATEVKSIMTQLMQQTKALSKKDIDAWRKAHQMALNFENPKRFALYEIYDYTTMIDTHVTGVANRIKMNIMRRAFKLKDLKGTENLETTNILETTWFKKFMSLAIDASLYGHSLIELTGINTLPQIKFDKVSLIPRLHVCPEYGVLLREFTDEPTKKGIPYREGDIANWCVEVGEPDDLGLLLKVTPHVISKKHVQIFWDNFAEKFGIPIIYASTDTRDVGEKAKVENMLDQMGASAWGLFPANTELKLIESAKGDAFQVFDSRIVRANSEISKGLAGQTMAFDDGSSQSQAQVHNEGFTDTCDYYADKLKDVINDKLIPLCILHGFPFANLRFDWDDTYEYTPAEILEREKMLLQYFDIEPKYFQERYNIPVLAKKEIAQSFF